MYIYIYIHVDRLILNQRIKVQPRTKEAANNNMLYKSAWHGGDRRQKEETPHGADSRVGAHSCCV